MQNIKKILITGPEATGKSALAQQLADYYNTQWNPEFARSYLTSQKYQRYDLDIMLTGQLQNEQLHYLKSNYYLFCDTGPEVFKIWSEHKFAACRTSIDNAFRYHLYDFTLLLYPDLLWEADPLREAPDEALRLELFNQYKALLARHHRPFQVVKGIGELRFQSALDALNL